MDKLLSHQGLFSSVSSFPIQPLPVLPKVRPLDQQPRHYLVEGNFSGPTPNLLNQRLGMGPTDLSFSSPWCSQHNSSLQLGLYTLLPLSGPSCSNHPQEETLQAWS